MVQTLLERAKPQLLTALSKQKERYPALNEHTENFLEKNYFCNAITWEVWVDLRGLWQTETNTLPDNPWEIFEKDSK
jgi:hypothetical protein